MAYLYRLHHCNLDRLRYCFIRKSSSSNDQQHWACFHPGWCLVSIDLLHVFRHLANLLRFSITIVVCAVMPSGTGHATHSFVWEDWANDTGYSSNGFVFLAGMLNGAYAVGTPDCVSHLAEEIPNPKRNIPLAIGAQMSIGFITAFAYTIAICKYLLFLHLALIFTTALRFSS